MWNARKTGNTLSGKWILRFVFFFAVWLYMVKTPAPNCMSFDPDSSVGKDSSCKCRRPQFDFWVGKIRWRRDRLPTPVFLGFPCGLAGKESACNAGALGSIPGLGKSPGEGRGYPLQDPGLENSMDCIIHGVPKSGHDWVTFTLTAQLCTQWPRYRTSTPENFSVLISNCSQWPRYRTSTRENFSVLISNCWPSWSEATVVLMAHCLVLPVLYQFFFFLSVPWSLWDPSFLARYGTRALGSESSES